MESRPPPDLSDPAALAAYRKELRGVAPVWRYVGVGLTVLGAGLLVARARHVIDIPVLVPSVTIVAGFGIMSIAILYRTLYHARRMRGG